jgi:hypothetical protein
MSKPPVLALPDFTNTFVLDTNARGLGIGVVLMHQGQPITFLSKTLDPKAQAASIYEKEAMEILRHSKSGSIALPQPLSLLEHINRV